jgi:hypothetical protein
MGSGQGRFGKRYALALEEHDRIIVWAPTGRLAHRAAVP